ncbi:hypothetical protein BFJ69_g16045 [Fusarium oxysporum]|uniref:Uncharacterized protein n=1 Tax=Fusarium oxysporum TaxID=5507 RepID=A0A420MCC7_FUSOX|nr:hypothetical protein BFJ69_g16045 [Fusarium oxysporum]
MPSAIRGAFEATSTDGAGPTIADGIFISIILARGRSSKTNAFGIIRSGRRGQHSAGSIISSTVGTDKDSADIKLIYATTLYTGKPFAGDFDALPHATFSLCVLATISTKDCGQAARGGLGRGAAP